MQTQFNSLFTKRVVFPSHPSRSHPTSRLARTLLVRASTKTPQKPDRELVGKIEEQLKQSGFTRQNANDVLKRWQEQVGHDIAPDDLQKLLVGQSTRIIGLVLMTTLIDLGAAYGAFSAGNFLGIASGEYGLPAVLGQAVAYIFFGYYVTAGIGQLLQLGVLAISSSQFNTNAGAFLEAVEAIAKPSGLDALDKVQSAVNSVKVLQALGAMSDLLKDSATLKNTNSDMLTDLGAYLTLDKAQKNGFDASAFGITDAQAAEIAVVYGKFDSNGDGVLSQDEFTKLCGKYAPDLSLDEIKAALNVIDTNKDGSISFDEFVRWWKKDIAP